MKRTFLILAVFALAAAAVTAQPFFAQGAQAAGTAQITKLEGKLTLINGMIGIQSKDKTYYVHIPGRLYGFVDGLKEGAQVKLEGYEYPLPQAPNYVNFLVTKLSLGGKDYDLSTLGQGMRGRGAFGPSAGNTGRGMGRGMGGYGWR